MKAQKQTQAIKAKAQRPHALPASTLFDAVLEAARRWHAALPEAAAFCDWPDDLAWQGRPAHLLPVARLLRSHSGAASMASAPLLAALQAVAPHCEWRHTYTADEVGQRFLDTYGWFELAGPEGHFVTHKARITVGYWGAGLYYPRHQHGPEELYTVVSGGATFHADSKKDATLGPGGTCYHARNQPHAMTTSNTPVLTLVFWRGVGLAATPRMSV